MQLIIDKIGKIEHAALDINGLTVIAGKNDTGKSTVGKVLYAIFRALEMGPVFFDYMKKTETLNEYIRPLCRRYIAVPSANQELRSQLAQFLKGADLSTMREEQSDKLAQFTPKQLLTLISAMVNSFAGAPPLDIAEYASKAQVRLQAIEQTSQNAKMAYNFSRTFDVMFNGTILNSKHKQPGKYEITQEQKRVLSVSFAQDSLDTQLDTVLAQSIFRDVVYIESPFVLERVQTRRKPHWNELKSVLHEKAIPQNWSQSNGNREIVNFIQENILGKAQISFNEDLDDFVYQVDDQSEKLAMANVACGVKSFVLLFLLLKLNVLNRETLLVLDEPENHLHPEFQIKYAQMIALLVKEGFSVVLTSHSPTFIQALNYYARKLDIQSKVSFYLAQSEKEKNYSTFQEVSANVEQIYANLIAPTDILFEFPAQETGEISENPIRKQKEPSSDGL